MNYESFQLLQYDGGQFYRSHHDSSVTDNTPAGHRILTFFLYLTDVEEGGETYFNRLDLAIKPKRGVSRELSLLLLVHLDDMNFTHRFPYRELLCGRQ